MAPTGFPNFGRPFSARDEAAWYSRPGSFRIDTAAAAPYIGCIERAWGIGFTGRTVLEVGGGNSNYGHAFRERGASVVALDLFHHRLAALPPAPGFSRVAGSAFQLPLPDDGRVDTVFSSLTIMHLGRETPTFVAEAYRVLEPGGLFCGIEGNYRSPVTWWRYATRPHSPNSFIFLPGRLLGWMRACGFEQVDAVPFNVRLTALNGRHPLAWLAGTCIAFHGRKPSREQQGSAGPVRNAGTV